MQVRVCVAIPATKGSNVEPVIPLPLNTPAGVLDKAIVPPLIHVVLGAVMLIAEVSFTIIFVVAVPVHPATVTE